MTRKKQKPVWIRQFYLWHWVSSAICLVSMMLFAFTGITLNHAGQIAAIPKTVEIHETLPDEFLSQLQATNDNNRIELPKDARRWIERNLPVELRGKALEWSEYDIYFNLARPGGDAWLSIDLETGELLYSKTYRGWIAYLNDLHKGRNTGTSWAVFLDVFSVACIVFCFTGLLLLILHAKRRPSTWPVVIIGLLLPFLILVFFVH